MVETSNDKPLWVRIIFEIPEFIKELLLHGNFLNFRKIIIDISTNILLKFENNNGMLEITVDDDGIGFNYNPNVLKLKSNTYGLFSIQERISDLGGIMEVESEINKGTKIKLSVPI